jgi:hypothetical protein
LVSYLRCRLARRVSRNVTRWRSGEMILRRAAIGLFHAKRSFCRIRGYRYLPLLIRALDTEPSKLDLTEAAA